MLPHSRYRNSLIETGYNDHVVSSKGNIEIGNDVWCGTSSIILSGVTIADGVVVGAGSVVTRSVGPYSIVAGNPARLLRKRFDDVISKQLLDIK